MHPLELGGHDEQPYIELFQRFRPMTGVCFPGYTRRPPAAMPGSSRVPSHHVVFRWHCTAC